MILSTKQIREKLTEFYTEYTNKYNDIAEQSRKEYVGTLPPGAKIPAEKKLYTEQSKEAFSNYSAKAVNDINDYIIKNLKEVQRLKTNPPHVEAVNYISLLGKLESPEADLIDIAMNRYGDNYISYKALYDIAAKHDIRDFKAPVLDELETVLKEEYNTVNKLESNLTLTGNTSKIEFMNENRAIPDFESMETVEGTIREPVTYY